MKQIEDMEYVSVIIVQPIIMSTGYRKLQDRSLSIVNQWDILIQ